VEDNGKKTECGWVTKREKMGQFLQPSLANHAAVFVGRRTVMRLAAGFSVQYPLDPHESQPRSRHYHHNGLDVGDWLDFLLSFYAGQDRDELSAVIAGDPRACKPHAPADSLSHPHNR